MDFFLVRPSLADGLHLSAEGRQLLRAMGNKIRLNDEPAVDRVVSANTPAAIQSAELFAERLDYVGVIEILPVLDAASPASVIAQNLMARGSTIVVIADEPVLGNLGAFLVGRPTFPPSLHAQASLVRDRTPMWTIKPGEMTRAQLLIA